MSIPFSKYINIASGVGGASNLGTRTLVGRIFTTNPLLSPSAILSFSGQTAAADVGAYFGTSSDEYLRAVKYFGYVSPLIAVPSSLQFARWANADSPAAIFGDKTAKVVATLKLIVAGSLSLQFGASVIPITGINFGSIVALADVATALQTALRANAAPELTTCTVTYNALTSQFIFTASPTGVTTETMSVVQVGAGITDVAAGLGWYTSTGAIYSDARVAEQPVDAFTRSVNANNNFGSFNFSKTTNAPTLPQNIALATYNKTLNVAYQFHINVSPANAVTWSAALLSIGGVGLTQELPTLNEYPEQIPMAVQAATDFTKSNGVVGYMYKQIAGVTPSVTDGPTSDATDALRINYYGNTQVNGQLVSFYQRGVLMGLATDPVDMNTYSNEQWLKSTVAAGLMSAQLSLGRIPANTQGIGIVLQVVQQQGVDPALLNGTISVGKLLNTTQKIFITQQTNDNNAWQQVQNIGYWLGCVIQSYVTTDGRTEYKAVYTLIYSKDDTIRRIDGSHQLI